MTQDNPPNNAADDSSASDSAPGNHPAKRGTQPPKKGKRRWLARIIKTVVVLIVLLIVLVGLTPMILSTGTARNYVIGKINQNINGRVAIGNWSIGWTSGIHVDDVKVFDAAERQILQLPRFSTGLNLIDALRGKIHLGHVVVDGLDITAERDANGVLNFQKLARTPGKKSEEPKKSDEPGAASSSPSTTPMIDGDLQLVNCRGTFADARSGSTVQASMAGAISLPTLSGIDQISTVQFTDFGIFALDSHVKLNGAIDDPQRACTFKNFTAELGYNASTLWNAILPFLDKASQQSLKDIKIDGTHTEIFKFGDSFPANKGFKEAIAALLLHGEIEIDRFEMKGAVLEKFVVPLSLAHGKLSIAYPEGFARKFAEPASLNGGHISLAGITVDLSDPHMPLSIPNDTELLDKISTNPVFSSYWLGDSFDNPMFVGATHSSGLISMTLRVCNNLPTDGTVKLASNKGVLKLDIKISKLEIGNAVLAKLVSSLGPLKPLLNLGGGKLNLDRVEGDVNDFHVSIHNGIVEESLTVLYGGKEPIISLSGTAEMATNLVHMTFGIPIHGKGDIKIPLSGPANDPKFDIEGALKDVKGVPGLGDLGNLIHKPDTTQPGDQKQDNPLNEIGNLFKKKDKKKAKPATQPQ